MEKNKLGIQMVQIHTYKYGRLDLTGSYIKKTVFIYTCQSSVLTHELRPIAWGINNDIKNLI